MGDKGLEKQKKAEQLENERRVENLIDIVENKTRTDRHLEQHSDIGDPDRLDHAKEVQDARETQIENLKNAIVYGDNSKNDTEDQISNLKDNYTFAEGYINHNGDHMSDKAYNNLKKKQENRKEQLDQLQ
ncbi:hypothetical protein [Candidatus Clostridium stratigraminis]|uniref:Uncharacterized protein n=1 Tax=Candidatus Clostridium stratigraminis TaxID=3381661 RepID=A0ABW8T7F3_9CLOT